MITELQARIMWAKKRLELLNMYDKNGGGGCCSPDTQDENANIITKTIEHDLEKIGKYIYSTPHLRHIMSPWMVDIRFGSEIPFGKPIECGDEDEDVVINKLQLLLDDPQKFTEYSSNGVIAQVSKDLVKMGYIITDRGFGMGGGHIGCPCTDEGKDRLINFVWMKYRKAIDSGLIFPYVAWFAPKIQGLWNREEIEEFLEKNKE
jgi:hypothetical protein